MNKNKHVVVIGAGFAGLAAASVLAKEGYKVTVIEKNDQPGGRARVWQKDGFTFYMGPSWYWMHYAALAPCCLSSSSSRPDTHRKNMRKSLMKDHPGYLKVAGLFFSMAK